MAKQIGMVVYSILIVAMCVSPARSQTLDESLREVDKLRAGFDTPFEEVERRCQELLRTYTDAEDQANIYYELAHVEAQSGLQRPEKAIAYVRAALDLPGDRYNRLRLYMYWGNAIEVANRGARGGALAAARRQATIPYLQGLNENLEYLAEVREQAADTLPVEKPRPGEMPVNNQDPTQIALAASRRARLEEDLVQHQDAYETQVVYLYTRFPFATSEIEVLAGQILDDEAAAERLVGLVKTGIRQRVDNMTRSIVDDIPTEFDVPGTDVIWADSGDSPGAESIRAVAPEGSADGASEAEGGILASDLPQRSGGRDILAVAVSVVLVFLIVLGAFLFARTRS